MLPSIPLSLYVHFPWCIKKCPYCDFNSHALREEIPEQKYVECLLRDFELALPTINGRTIQSIFFGGGTPSLFSPYSISHLLNALKNKIAFAKNIEITLEANPGTAEAKRFKGFQQAGVNRLSIGAQSFQDEKLKALGRIHNSQEAILAAQMAHDAGIHNFNIDLMHSLPNQSPDDALFDLKTALSLKPTHISWYQLTIEPNTEFYHRPPKQPEEPALEAIYQQGHDLLRQSGYEHYEISAYAKPGHTCRHNLNYWQFGDYVGIGAGAHSKITLNQPDGVKILRCSNHRHPKQYMMTEKKFITETKIIPKKELPLEFMMNALRLCKPIPTALFTERTQLPIHTIQPILNTAEQAELLTFDDQTLQTTAKGNRYLNDLVALFMV